MNQKGRSMVEMLGVLAVIGVLSAGALAGYSNAMKKIRLNNFTVAYAELLHNAMEILPKVDDGMARPGGTTLKAGMLKALNIIPSTMSTKGHDDGVYIFDKYNNQFWVFYGRSTYGIGFGFKPVELGEELCRTAVAIAKEHKYLYRIVTDRYVPDSESYNNISSKYNSDIQKMTVEEIRQMCTCDQSVCRLYVSWK
ncbi:MAG TPA: hypothetical protein DIC64_01485 [Alphaproteobacteria bacterium]|nr:hypothetical protein [Alphaproteobacteria bacterium]